MTEEASKLLNSKSFIESRIKQQVSYIIAYKNNIIEKTRPDHQDVVDSAMFILRRYEDVLLKLQQSKFKGIQTSEEVLDEANLLLKNSLNTFRYCEMLLDAISELFDQTKYEEYKDVLQYAQACIKDHLTKCNEEFETGRR